MSRLRAVLEIVRESGGATTLPDLAHRLGVAPAIAAEMVAFWQRRGALAPAVADIVICTAPCVGCPIASCPAARNTKRTAP